MKNKFIKSICGGFIALIISIASCLPAFADGAISISPLTQRLILNPGDTYRGSFKVVNQAGNDEDLRYHVTVEPFFVDENYEIYYDDNGDYNQIVDWITLYDTDGTLSPNSSEEIHFAINVPDDAPAGGQYAAIKATSVNDDQANGDGDGAMINVQYGVAYTIFADIAGTTERGGEIIDASVPSFLLSGKLSGSSSVKNTGNVHGTATYTLQVWPLFSSEEAYTNAEDPEKMNIMPERTFYNETTWEDTPMFGIFNVVYTVEFEGVTTEVSKMIIVCPLWLLFIIIFAIVAIIIYFVMRSKSRKK